MSGITIATREPDGSVTLDIVPAEKHRAIGGEA